MNRRHFCALTGLVLTSSIVHAKSDGGLVRENEKSQTPFSFVPGSWTLAILPDTQNYSKTYPGMLPLQTQWLVDHKEKYNIKYVLQNGDLTDQNSEVEWDRIDRAFAKLDGILPYAVVPGNHDYVEAGKADRSTSINDVLSPARFRQFPGFGGVMDEGRIENNYHLFNAGGQDWILLCLEWAPRDKALEWASEILVKYPNRKAIVMTHAYLYSDSTRYDWKKKGKQQHASPHSYNTKGGLNDGQEVWEKLVKKHENIFMVISGHVGNDGLGFLVGEGDFGNKVYEMAVNFQKRPLGGEGWLRMLHFLPNRKAIQVVDYSPFYEKYDTGPESQFRIEL